MGLPNFFLTTLAQSLNSGGSEPEVFVSSITTLDGQVISTSDFAQFGRGVLTIDPQSTARTEFISFTSVDSSGIGFTGITRGLSFKDNSSISNNKKFHPVGAPVLVSFGTHNILDMIASFADVAGAETISGLWTFTTAPIIPDPVTGKQPATKDYVDSVAIAGAPLANSSTIGVTKLSVNPVSSLTPIAVGDNDTRVPTQGENDALVGTVAPPSSSNKYVTNNDTGTSGANNILRLDSSGKLPALDGSNLLKVKIVLPLIAGESITVGQPVGVLPVSTTQVAFDANFGIGNSYPSGTSIVQLFTVGSNNNRFLLVPLVTSNTSTFDVTGITYAGAALTKLASLPAGSFTGNRLELWYLVGPATGTNNLIITSNDASNSVNFGIFSYFNVAQTAPEVTQTGTGGGGSASATVTPLSAGAVVFGCTGTSGSTSGTAFVANQIVNNGGVHAGDSGVVPSPVSETISVSSASNNCGAIAISMAPAGGAQTPQVFRSNSAGATSSNAFVGFAQNSATANQAINVLVGGVDSNQSGLTIGALYYLNDTPGSKSTSPGTINHKIGVAVSTTQILLTNVW